MDFNRGNNLIADYIMQVAACLALLACAVAALRKLGWPSKAYAAGIIAGALMLAVSLLVPWLLLPAAFLTVTAGALLMVGWAHARRWLQLTALAGVLSGMAGVASLRHQALWDGLFKLMEPRTCSTSSLPARTIANLPFKRVELVEAIAALSNGDFIVSVASRGELWKVTPSGQTSRWVSLPAGEFDQANFNGMTGGVVQGQDGAVYSLVLARESRLRGLWRIDTETGSKRLWSAFPASAQPNGLALAPNGDFYVSDSARGSIWHVPAPGGAPREWYRDKALGAGAWLPMPTANGIKVKGAEIYVSNSLQKRILRIHILPGGKPGEVQVIDEGIAADDFDVDEAGNIFLTTHPFNTVIRLDAGQPCAVIAGPADNVVGPTAAMFGRAPANRRVLYVVTDGGFSRPYPGARSAIVAIDTSGKGGPLQNHQ